MAETNTEATPDGAGQATAEAVDGNIDAPAMPPQESPTPDIADLAETPEATGGETDAPSNTIDGISADIGTAAAGAERPTAEQDMATPEAANPEASAPDAEAPEDKDGRRGQTYQKADKPDKPDKASKQPETEKPTKAERAPRLPKGPKEDKQVAAAIGGGKGSGKTAAATGTPEPPTPPPRDAMRPGEKKNIEYIPLAELHPFKGHPFKVRDDDAMQALVESVRERGVDQPAIVRPREDGGYELVAGHRRKYASELAGYENIACIVKNMTDDEAVLAMAESNFNQRSEILPSERAQALKMQLDAIKRQGVRSGVAPGDVGKRSNEIIAVRNKMSIKDVQRYISLNKLIPELMQLVDDKKIKKTVAVDLSYIRPKNQRYIAVAIDAQQSAPSGAQAQRMRELDQKNVLNGDTIDGIMLEEKKEEIRVILNSQELGKYFGPDKTPREMKDTILKLLDEYKEKQPPELAKPAKNKEQAVAI